MALVCISFGLRISECLALKWSDVDWLNAKLTVERGIVRGVVDDVKTEYSGRAMAIDPAMLEVLKAWRLQTEFATTSDWIFASPVKLGHLPLVLSTHSAGVHQGGQGRGNRWPVTARVTP